MQIFVGSGMSVGLPRRYHQNLLSNLVNNNLRDVKRTFLYLSELDPKKNFFFSKTTILSNEKLLKKSYNVNLIVFDCSPSHLYAFILICSERFVVIFSEQRFVDFLMKNEKSRYCLTGQDLQRVRFSC